MITDPVTLDRIAENQQLRAEIRRAADLIETGRTDEALNLLRLLGRPAIAEEPQ
ncbi:hypothetical protein ABT093_09845 [Kitasatospora sp. NPDC002551]|uniref:hypothetical protein n=1 Tax=Kitasatospora sp. NPDC002551 TaxID=3154539 RepID=UPI0033242357